MGLDVPLESENLRQSGPRSKVVRPPFRSRSKVDRDLKGEPSGIYFNLKSSDGNFRESNLRSSTSPHRKSMPSRPPKLNVDDNTVLKRSSVYQTSSEVMMMKLKEGQRKMKLKEGQRKMKLKEGQRKESTYNDDAFLSFEIVDSSSRTHRNDALLLSEQTQSHVGSLNVEMKSPSLDSTHSIPTKSMEFLDLSFRDLPGQHLNLSTSCSSGGALANNSSAGCLSDTELPCNKEAPNLANKECIEEQKSNCTQVLAPGIDGKSLSVRDIAHALPKSFSTKVGMLDSPFQPKKEILKASPRIPFNPVKRIFDPIMKSKSLRNLSVMGAEMTGIRTADSQNINRNGSFRKSLLSDFSEAAQKMEQDRISNVSDQVSSTISSPAHLHAVLKLEFTNGAPSFEFSIKDPEDVLYAKTWKTDSALNWAYTFHSCKRKSYSIGRGAKERHGQPPPMVGQMQVSCFLCSEANENGSLANYMVTEFILYDIAQARRSICIEESSCCPSDTIRLPESSVTEDSLPTNSSTETDRYQHHGRRTSSDCDSDPSTSYPWSPTDLHPHLEIAAITIQIPFTKDLVKDVQMEEIGSKEQNSSSVSTFHNGRDGNSNCMNPAVVKVVTPSGTHGLPSTEEGGPSSLLDRWRFGGGCDCGGWDMACPIAVFDNPCGSSVDCSTTGSQQPMLLFFQGKKEKVPAVCIKSDGKGQYSVYFHAHLSALQAFSICIAILHGSDAFPAVGHEKNKQMLYSNSLKVLLEEEVKQLIEAVAEEKRKAKKISEQIPQSYFLDPPFSPMGRS